jgi:hypothetical protein
MALRDLRRQQTFCIAFLFAKILAPCFKTHILEFQGALLFQLGPKDVENTKEEVSGVQSTGL